MRIGIHQPPGVLRVLLPMTPRHVVAFERGWTGAHRGGFFVPPLWAPDQPRPPMKPRHIPKGCGRLNDDEDPDDEITFRTFLIHNGRCTPISIYRTFKHQRERRKERSQQETSRNNNKSRSPAAMSHDGREKVTRKVAGTSLYMGFVGFSVWKMDCGTTVPHFSKIIAY